ncbi:hypothetical protein IC620_05705 [Hazenella sp. IB182357]|uniref:Zinc-finger domain-containing protein n=1 Tax=Polycladospora coralii TaxID=2771432 RepID=A0A926NEA4_9BACL|nr:hypothetical protein [Polycladospora coralii]MBD1371853.1 hypothetical protein [Polycladospora coralii]MBS7529314.1 hypothetical protein [Polycladospora coralii]
MKRLTCKEVEMVIERFVDEELDVLEEMYVEDHCRTCSACQFILEAKLDRALSGFLDTNMSLQTPPLHLVDDIMVAVSKQPQTQDMPFFKTMLRFWQVGMALLTSFFLLLLYWDGIHLNDSQIWLQLQLRQMEVGYVSHVEVLKAVWLEIFELPSQVGNSFIQMKSFLTSYQGTLFYSSMIGLLCVLGLYLMNLGLHELRRRKLA